MPRARERIAQLDGVRVAPQSVLGMFLIGQQEIVWVGDLHRGFGIVRCVQDPSRAAPVCQLARGG